MVEKQGIGSGALIELNRSGQVIPKIERVISAAEPRIPDRCPSCSTELVWEKDYLYCPNSSLCSAQIEHSIEHFFKTLGNIDGFGSKTITRLHGSGVNSVYEVYQLTSERLQQIGFGEKTSQNLIDQLQRSRIEAIEDWRFLGAFGIYRMGLGNCERLLQNYRLPDIFSLTVDDIIEIEGFAEKTAVAVVNCLQQISEQFELIDNLQFNLTQTPLIKEQPADQKISPILGKTIVFTGAMKQGKRDDMKKQAKQLGAKVSNSVTGNTDYLVTGDNVGVTKINSARDKGVRVISENEYLALLSEKSQ